ncbi:hypothetical protein H6G81_28700 [Scytonema hofmannii FACHB-248]|uniref:Uncharacterized protein n=1 Tax=Scytonema hofmannii FACHB-248 TaxID=1842502 RepID=A0ABR8GZE7_9CYAN|nr:MULTISPECIES: hypothetical protein [Nostocales]MBD2608390.1 hypothetical protein [Scytonema hofmannii FACHB-248]
MQPLKTLQNLTDYYFRLAEESRNHDRETYQLGLIKSDEKLRMLEQDAYRKTRAGADASEELRLMEFLLKAVRYQNQLKEKSGDSLVDVIRFFWHLILIGSTCFAVGKFVVAPTKIQCLDNDLQSEYCQIIRDKVEYFRGK